MMKEKGSEQVCFEKFLEFCSLFSEGSLTELASELKRAGYGDNIEFEQWELYVYKLFQEIDNIRKDKRLFILNGDNTRQSKLVETPGKKEGKSATKTFPKAYQKERCNLI